MRRLVRALSAGAGLLLCAALAAGCTTSRKRESPVGLGSLLQFRDAETYAYFQHVYRSGNLYLDFRPALVVDAIVKDRQYRALYVQMLKAQFLLPDAEVERLQAEQERHFETRVDILLFTYEGTNRPSRLAKKDAPWRILLRDDDGQLLTPASITKIKETSTTFLYIDKYFSGLDRWSQVYEVRFPKLSKARLGQPIGRRPFELILTGVKGTVTLKWEDPRIFYRLAGGEE